MASDERLRELEEKYEDFTVYDNAGEKIGKVDELFVDEDDREEYLGVKMGLFGLSGTTLVPMEISRVDEQGRRIEVAETKERVKDAPTYNDDDEVDSGFEDRIRRHFGLESSTGQSSYGRAPGEAVGGSAAGERMGADDDASSGDRAMQERHPDAWMDGEDQERGGRETYQNREEMGPGFRMGGASAGSSTPSGSIPDVETGERGRTEEDDAGSMTRGHREGGDREDLGASGSTQDAESAGGAMIQRGGEPGGEGSGGERSGTQSSAELSGASSEARSGGTGEGQTGDLRRAEDERVREAVREGVREGIREGLRESGGRSGSGNRGDSDASGSAPGSGSAGESMIQHGGASGGEGEPGERGASTTGSRDEARDAQQSSRESEQEEGGISKVWRRASR